jgi:hypothetical protein
MNRVEGTKACPPYPPLRSAILLYSLFGFYRIREGPQWQGGETPRERLGFLRIFTEPIILIFIWLLGTIPMKKMCFLS